MRIEWVFWEKNKLASVPNFHSQRSSFFFLESIAEISKKFPRLTQHQSFQVGSANKSGSFASITSIWIELLIQEPLPSSDQEIWIRRRRACVFIHRNKSSRTDRANNSIIEENLFQKTFLSTSPSCPEKPEELLSFRLVNFFRVFFCELHSCKVFFQCTKHRTVSNWSACFDRKKWFFFVETLFWALQLLESS